ncbi:hypothetical protein pb186bvf_018705 [Paramecium bursaria]
MVSRKRTKKRVRISDEGGLQEKKLARLRQIKRTLEIKRILTINLARTGTIKKQKINIINQRRIRQHYDLQIKYKNINLKEGRRKRRKRKSQIYLKKKKITIIKQRSLIDKYILNQKSEHEKRNLFILESFTIQIHIKRR